LFLIKVKKINAPSYWVYDQLHKNFSSPWSNIGIVKWNHGTVIFDLPDNINEL
jgi:hypothetical protein